MGNENSNRIRIGDRVSVVRRGKKRIYQAEFHFEHQHRRISLKTTNLKVARRQATEIEYQLLVGSFELQGKQPKTNSGDKSMSVIILSQLIVSFLEFLRTEGRRPKTITKYKGILNTFLEFATEQGVENVSDVNLNLIDRFRAKRKPDLSDKSMHHEGALIKLFLEWCKERGWIEMNPLQNRRFAPPKPKKNRGTLTLQQVNDIIEQVCERLQPIIAMIAFTGMRSGECQRLRVEDVELKTKWIHIVSREGLETKTGENWKVPMHPILHRTLKRTPSNKSGYYFTAAASKKYPQGDHWISPKHLNEDFQEVLVKLGIPAGRKNAGYTIHDLRHAFKSICISQGVPREYVDLWQGHATFHRASDLYFHAFDEESQRLIQKVPFGDSCITRSSWESFD